MFAARVGVVRSRILAIGLTACLGAGLVSAAAPATARTGPVTLAGTNTVKLSAPAASMVVDLPQSVAARDLCVGNRDVRVTGSADSVVVLLIAQDVANPVPAVFGRLPRHEGAHTFFSLC